MLNADLRFSQVHAAFIDAGLFWEAASTQKITLHLATTFEYFVWQDSTESPAVQAAIAPGMLVDWLSHLYGAELNTFFWMPFHGFCFSCIMILGTKKKREKWKRKVAGSDS